MRGELGVGGFACTGPGSLLDCPTLGAIAIVLCAGRSGWKRGRRSVTREISGSSLPDSRSATPEGAKDRAGDTVGALCRLAAGTAGQRVECEKRNREQGVWGVGG